MTNKYSTEYYSPLPDELDLVYCHFPDRKRLPSFPILEDTIPYNDPHYCMVLGCIDDIDEVVVVYGTSKTNKISKNDFILKAVDAKGTGLIVDTKWTFSPSGIAILPYNKKWFSPRFRQTQPFVGKFPETKKDDLLKHIYNPCIQRILDDLYDLKNNQIMLPKKCWDLDKYKIR